VAVGFSASGIEIYSRLKFGKFALVGGFEDYIPRDLNPLINPNFKTGYGILDAEWHFSKPGYGFFESSLGDSVDAQGKHIAEAAAAAGKLPPEVPACSPNTMPELTSRHFRVNPPSYVGDLLLEIFAAEVMRGFLYRMKLTGSDLESIGFAAGHYTRRIRPQTLGPSFPIISPESFPFLDNA